MIRKREEKRLRFGHLWAFSNEIAGTTGDPGPGDLVRVLRHDGRFLGLGFYNPRSLIAVRIVSDREEAVDAEFFRSRLEHARRLRQSMYPTDEAYRMVHGESDGLPGLIVDVYGSSVVVQILSAGMEARRDTIADVLRNLLDPDCIVARNDTPLRELEGLTLESSVPFGVPGPCVVHEHGIEYTVDISLGQKTGLFLDQKDNRIAVRRYLKGRSVLDCFSNVGGFGLNAAVAGATDVTVVDASPSSVDAAKANFRRNSLSCREAVVGDAFDYLAEVQGRHGRFGGIILDPPAFTKNKRSVATALKAYRRLNSLAMSVLDQDGILVSASCSHHVTREDFVTMLAASAYRAGRRFKILEFRGAAADHPVLASMPETEYLKLAICAVT